MSIHKNAQYSNLDLNGIAVPEHDARSRQDV